MINISVLYFACYRCSLHIDKLNPLPSTFQTDSYQMYWADTCRSNLHVRLRKYKLLMFSYICTAVHYVKDCKEQRYVIFVA